MKEIETLGCKIRLHFIEEKDKLKRIKREVITSLFPDTR